MATKKTQLKHVRSGAVKRSGSRKKTVAHLALKKSAGNSSKFQKAPRGTVILGSKLALSPYAMRALSVFSAGVQRALAQLAQRNIPAVVIENGRRVEAVPTKVDGRYVVADSRERESAPRSKHTHKRGARAV